MSQLVVWIERQRTRIKNRSKSIKINKGCNVTSNSFFEGNNVLGDNTYFRGSLGKGTYIGSDAHIDAKIGRYCSIAENVKVLTGKHPSKDFVSTHPAFYSIAKQAGFSYTDVQLFDESSRINGYGAIIGNDVWIGSGVMINGGVRIGNGSIIAAGSVVTKDVEPYSIVGGVPARLIRKRFSEENIIFLEEFQWWEKDEDWLRENVVSFQSILSFISKIQK